MNPTKRSIVISFGRKADNLVVEGVLAAAGQTAANVNTNYLVPLTAMVYQSVTISNSGRYDEKWVMTSFEYDEEGGKMVSFKYRMEFIRGLDANSSTPGIVIT